MSLATLPGIHSEMIATPRLRQHVLFSGTAEGIPVLFLHGNFSSSTFWEETMLSLPAQYRSIAPDLRGYGQTEDLLIDATLGVEDWCQDLLSLLNTLQISQFHIIGWSLSCSVLYRLIATQGSRILSATLVAPVSPYGFGGTYGLDGIPCHEDFAGSGGGVVHPEFIRRISIGDRSTADPNASPRNVINTFYYKKGFRAAREEEFLTAALLEKTGPERYPGDFIPSANWPHIAPGKWGPINATSPCYMFNDPPAFIAAPSKPPILWVRGIHDLIVSDNSLFEFGTLGKMGIVPGWPGEEGYPPQPMVGQTRYVLDQYVAHGGQYTERVLDAAHSPHIEQPQQFNNLLHQFLNENQL